MLSKNERERLVFEDFAKAIGLMPGGTIESRLPPEPDILYTSDTGESLAFELVEIVDNEFSATLGQQLATKAACEIYLNGLPPESSAAFRAQYGNADIFISFKDGLSIVRRRNSLARIFSELRTLPMHFEGDAFDEPGPLADICDRITIHRGEFNGPCFDVPGVTWVGDPTVEAIAGKMEKTYVPRGTLKLLGYIDSNPMYPEEVWLNDLDGYFVTLGVSCQFEQIYVYECRTRTVRRWWQRPRSPQVT